MKDVSVKISLAQGARLPEYKTALSAGADLYAFTESDVVLEPGQRVIIPTGLRIELPPGFEAQVRPRSGLAINNGITCLNSPGTIDADYRGELGIILINHGKEKFTVRNGDRIAQLVIARAERAVFEKVTDLPQSGRGTGGFGSTGL